MVLVVIAGVAIAMASHRYSERHLNATALMRCLGCSQAFIVQLLTTQLLLIGLLGSSLGCGLGWLAQQALFTLLQSVLPQQPASVSSWGLAMGVLTGLTLLLGFGLPPLLRLKQVSPLRVLRRELAPMPSARGAMPMTSGALASVLPSPQAAWVR
jgi:putative ABC transport system permease protein